MLTRTLYASRDNRKGFLTVQVDLDKIETALGRWLAETIPTTLRDDDASLVHVLLPATEVGLSVREMGERLMRRSEILSARELEELLQSMEAWATKLRAESRMYGATLYQRRVYDHQWATYYPDKQTPEQYFDEEARRIRAAGGVILAAGLDRRRLPEVLAKTMAGGRGVQLLRAWDERRQIDHTS